MQGEYSTPFFFPNSNYEGTFGYLFFPLVVRKHLFSNFPCTLPLVRSPVQVGLLKRSKRVRKE